MGSKTKHIEYFISLVKENGKIHAKNKFDNALVDEMVSDLKQIKKDIKRIEYFGGVDNILALAQGERQTGLFDEEN